MPCSCSGLQGVKPGSTTVSNHPISVIRGAPGLTHHVPGGAWSMSRERRSTLLIDKVERLLEVIADVRQRHPFDIVAMVILPDHLHAVWRLPPGDTDYRRLVRLDGRQRSAINALLYM